MEFSKVKAVVNNPRIKATTLDKYVDLVKNDIHNVYERFHREVISTLTGFATNKMLGSVQDYQEATKSWKACCDIAISIATHPHVTFEMICKLLTFTAWPARVMIKFIYATRSRKELESITDKVLASSQLGSQGRKEIEDAIGRKLKNFLFKKE